MHKDIVVLPGDGVGSEIMETAQKVLEAIAREFDHTFTFTTHKIGGDAIDHCGIPLPEETLNACRESDAALLGAVGGKKWDTIPAHNRPEQGLLKIRKALGLFANIRPVKSYTPLLEASPLKEETVKGSDMVLFRELTGGLYFGEPSERRNQGKEVVDTLHYHQTEMERIIDKAFQSAQIRRKKLTSVDKANVLESSKMWREVVEKISGNYPDVEVDHLYVDAAAMKLVTNPSSFDVIVTENLFGDILSDEASVLTGSLGMLPSASLGEGPFGLYEPVHGSAPDIAGLGIANPFAMILSAAMMLRYSFGLEKEACCIEDAILHVLELGNCTPDLNIKDGKLSGTQEIAEMVIEVIASKSVSDSICEVYI